LSELRGIGPDDSAQQESFSRELDAFAVDLARHYRTPPADRVPASALVSEILVFIGQDRLLATHPAYAQGGWLDKVVNAIAPPCGIRCGCARLVRRP
jgi:hypothetical protein